MRCPQCGYHSYDELTSCKKCGTELPCRRTVLPPAGGTGELFAAAPATKLPPVEPSSPPAVTEKPQDVVEEVPDASNRPKKEFGLLFEPVVEELAQRETLPWQIDVDGGEERGLVGRRVLACLIDTVMVVAVWSAAVLVSLELMGWSLSQWQELLSQHGLLRLSYYAVLIVVVFSYFPLSYYGWGRTLGHAVCGLHVVSEQGSSLRLGQGLFRTVGGVLSLLSGGLGFALALRSDHLRGWNDRLAGTRVVDESELALTPEVSDEEN